MRILSLWRLALPAVALSCGSDDDALPTDIISGTTPSILIAERFNTPDGRVMYMGAFGELPSTPIDVSQLTELGAEGHVFACAGYAFYYDPTAGRINRYTVTDDHELVASGALLVGQEGIVGWTAANVCASDSSAFILNESGGRAVEYDPTEMVIVSSFDLPLPDGVTGNMYLQFFEPSVYDGQAYFPLEAVDWDTLEVATAKVAVFDVDTRGIRYVYDDRCAGGLSGHVDAEGNFTRYMGYAAFFNEYNPGQPTDCVLRLERDAEAFVSDYRLDAGAGETVQGMWPIDDDHALVLVNDGPPPPADDLWSWFSMPITPQVMNLDSGALTPYPHVPNIVPMNARKLKLDGINYYQVYSYDAEGLVTSVDVVALGLDGTSPGFTLIGGDVLALARLR